MAFFLPSVTLIIVGQLKKLNKVEEKNKENVPSIVSFENNKIVFSDGVVAEIFQNSENLFFIQSHFNKHYYKTRESAIRAVYIYKKENIIIQTDLVK